MGYVGIIRTDVPVGVEFVVACDEFYVAVIQSRRGRGAAADDLSSRLHFLFKCTTNDSHLVAPTLLPLRFFSILNSTSSCTSLPGLSLLAFACSNTVRVLDDLRFFRFPAWAADFSRLIAMRCTMAASSLAIAVSSALRVYA
jgi:hypothetical protein